MQTQQSIQDTGAWEVRRGFRLPAPLDNADASAMAQALSRIPGIHRVHAEAGRRRLVVWYDVRRVAYQQILTSLAEAGLPPPDTWWSRRKQGWYRFTEANDRENAKAPPAACCNKPPR